MNFTKPKVNCKMEWDGEYRGVRFSVVNWRLGWNYYLHIPIEQLPPNLHKTFNLHPRTYQLAKDGDKHISFDYSDALIIADLDWHGGITLYEKQYNEVGKHIGYNLGCDYMHLWDEGKGYTIDYVLNDVCQSIDKLWELVPNLKLRCSWNGKYYNANEVYYTEYGACVALENKCKHEGVQIKAKADGRE